MVGVIVRILVGPVPVLVEREVYLLLGLDTTFIRKRRFLAIRAGYYIY